MFKVDKYLSEHPDEDNVDIKKDDFEEGKRELEECIKREGIINDVKYSVEYGKVKKVHKLKL